MNPTILNIQMVPAGVELVLKGLAKLPIEEAGPLFNEIKGQAEYQLQQLAQQQQQQPAGEAANAPAQTEGAEA